MICLLFKISSIFWKKNNQILWCSIYVMSHILIPRSHSPKKSIWTLRIKITKKDDVWADSRCDAEDLCWQIMRVDQGPVFCWPVGCFYVKKMSSLYWDNFGTIWPSYIHWCSETSWHGQVRFFIRQPVHFRTQVANLAIKKMPAFSWGVKNVEIFSSLQLPKFYQRPAKGC